MLKPDTILEKTVEIRTEDNCTLVLEQKRQGGKGSVRLMIWTDGGARESQVAVSLTVKEWNDLTSEYMENDDDDDENS